MNKQGLFDKFIDFLPGGMVQCKLGSQIEVVQFSKGMSALSGCTKEAYAELGRNDAAMLVCLEDRIVIANALRCCAQTKQDFDCIFHVPHTAGTPRQVTAHGSFAGLDEDGSPLVDVMVLSCGTDFSGQRRLEYQLKESDERLRAAVKHSGLLYWEYDLRSHRALMDSQSFHPLSLPPVLENYPESFLELGMVYPEDAEAFRRCHENLKKGQTHTECLVRIRTPESDVYSWKHLKFTVIDFDHGKPVYAVATSADANAYKNLERHFNQAIGQNGIWSWEFDIKNHKVMAFDGQNLKNDPFGYGNIVANVPERLISDNAVYPEDIDIYRDLYRRLEAGEDHVSVKVRKWCVFNNQYTWFEIIYTRLKDSGKTPRALGTCRDISAEKRLDHLYQEELRHRARIMSTVIANTQLNLTNRKVEGFYVDGKNILTEELAHVTDFRKRVSYFLDDISLSDEDNAKFSIDNLLKEYEKGRRLFSVEFFARRKNEDVLIFVHTDCRILLEPDNGDIVAFFYNNDNTAGFINDKTVQAVLEFDYDMAGVLFRTQQVRYLTLREGATSLPPLKSEHYDADVEAYVLQYAVTETPSQLIRDLQIDAIVQNLETMSVYTVEYDLREPDGSVRRKQSRFAFCGGDRNVIAATRMDVEDLLEAEKSKQKELADALNMAEKANNAKSEFLATISHEIRTPMNVITGVVDLAEDELEHPAVLADYLGKIKIAGGHLLNLVNNVLDMAKIESGEMELHPELCHYEEFVCYIDSVVRPLYDQKHVQLVFSGTKPWPSIMVDKLRFNQIMFNILSNSIKFTPENGRVELCCEFSPALEGIVWAKFRITDSGIGMSEEFQKRLFQPFTQENVKVVPSAHGTGLGLSIAKGIVEKMSGSIEVQSQQGVGTSFIIWLPLSLSTEEKLLVQQGRLKEGALQGKRVLVAEDHPMNQLIISKLLQKKGVDVIVAGNGKECVDKFMESAPGFLDGILMDIRMPVMDGLEAARTIRESGRPDAQTIPIIAMTANAYDEDRRKSQQAGMNEHLPKPIQAQKLYAALAQYLNPEQA